MVHLESTQLPNDPLHLSRAKAFLIGITRTLRARIIGNWSDYMDHGLLCACEWYWYQGYNHHTGTHTHRYFRSAWLILRLFAILISFREAFGSPKLLSLFRVTVSVVGT